MIRLYLSMIFLSPVFLTAQPFLLQTDSPLAEQLADSRSVNLIDINGDGWDDIFISNGPSEGADNELYLNQGEGLFIRSLDGDLVSDGAKSDGATFGDMDNDGDPDAYVVTWYGDENEFYVNEGDGRLQREASAGLNAAGSFAETAAWGDYDRDGFLDLFVTTSGGRDLSNLLFHNKGDGTFEPVSLTPELSPATHSRGANWVDVDGDFDLDLFIVNENQEPNQLYLNTGDPDQPFTLLEGDQSVSSARSGISASWGDVDNDGDLDLFVANAGYFKESNNQLFLNNGKGRFEEAIRMAPLTDGGASYGSAFGDIDNDGDLDLLVANGFAKEGLEDRLYLNDGNGHFTRLENAFDVMPGICSFGAAFSDLDQDGFLDLVIAHCNNNTETEYANSYYRNQGNRNHWLLLRLEGTTSNRSAIGTCIRVTARIGGEIVVQTRTIDGQTGYCGQGSLMAHFGLGNAKEVMEVRIFWPNGMITILESLAADQILHIRESDSDEMTAGQLLEFFPVTKSDSMLVRARGEDHRLKESPRILLQDANGLQLFDEPMEADHSGFWQYHLKQDIPPGKYLLRISCGKKTYLQRMVL